MCAKHGTCYTGASQRYPAALPSSHQADGEELAVQKASNLFLQQIEDSRRKYASEVEEAKVGKTILLHLVTGKS